MPSVVGISEDYYIDGPENKVNTVELWSRIRLPFEPKGWLRDMRSCLKSSIKMLKGSEQSMLHAVYISEQNDYCDIENILLYNVGSGVFSDLSRKGLCFERKFSLPPQIPDRVINMPHYHCYKVINIEQELQYWKKGEILANWIKVSCPAIRSNSKPHSFWYAIKKGQIHTSYYEGIPNCFGMELRIDGPKGININLASVAKPLLDGIICAFHVHDGTNMSLLSGRLADLTGMDKGTVENMLMDSANSILGKTRLLHPFGQGVQWNPADDLCMAVKILFNSCLPPNTWQLSGELFTISAI